VSDRRILIVDDDAPVLEMMKEVFRGEGYTVFTADSAENALEILKTETIMLMFLDLWLPGMKGIELCKIIRKENQIGIIHAFAGYTNFAGLLECRTAGFDDCFVKPIEVKLLLRAAEDAFEKLKRWKIGGPGSHEVYKDWLTNKPINCSPNQPTN